MSEQRFYLAIIEKAPSGYGVFFPDLPGCTSFGKTVSKAAENAYLTAQAHAAISAEYGQELPTPRSPDAIPTEQGVKEAARVLIPVEIGEQPIRVNISLPASALAALDRTAKETVADPLGSHSSSCSFSDSSHVDAQIAAPENAAHTSLGPL